MLTKDVLFIVNDETLINMLEFHIHSEYNVKVHSAKTKEEISSILTKVSNISCIIGEYQGPKDILGNIYSYLHKTEKHIPIIMLTKQFPSKDPRFESFLFDAKGNCYLKLPLNEAEFFKTFEEIIHVNLTSSKEKYRRIRGDKVNDFIDAGYSIFMLDDYQKYVNTRDIDGPLYTGTNANYFVKIKDYQKFFSSLSENLVKLLFSPKVSISKKIDIQLNAVETVQQSLLNVGLTESEIQVAQTYINTSIKVINTKPAMSKLLSKMIKYNHFTHELALMSGYLSATIVRYTSWASDHSMKKLTMAALIQDLSLEDDNLAKIKSLKDPFFLELPEPEKKKVENHCKDSLEGLNNISGIEDIANNIKMLVENHHERPNGDGFPKQLDSKTISPLSAVFIIAHEFSHRVLAKPITKELLDQIKKDFEVDYSVKNFKQPYQAFIEAFKSQKISK